MIVVPAMMSRIAKAPSPPLVDGRTAKSSLQKEVERGEVEIDEEERDEEKDEGEEGAGESRVEENDEVGERSGEGVG